MVKLSLSFFVILNLTVVLSTGVAIAQPQYMTDTKEELEALLSQSWQLAEEAFSAEERRVLESLDIIVTDSPNFTIARTNLDTKQIEISHGFGVMTWGMSVSMVIAADFGKPNFIDQYARYLAQHAGVSNSLKLPWELAGLSQNEINKLMSPGYRQKIADFMIGSLSFILLHECGHHIVKYRKGEKYPINPSLSENREIEKKADFWSAKTMAKSGIAPIYAFLPHLYFHYRDENAVRSEQDRSHPPEILRIYDIIFYTIMYLDEYYDSDLTYAKLPLEDVKKKGIRALQYTEGIIASSKYFDKHEIYGDIDDIRNSSMRNCMRDADKRCMVACQNKYRNPYDLCRNKLCSSKKQKQISWFRCEVQLRRQ